MNRIAIVLAALGIAAAGLRAQSPPTQAVEIPLSVESGRLMVAVDGPDGSTFRFVVGLSNSMLTASGAARIGDAASSLRLGGVPVATDGLPTVRDSEFAGAEPVPDGVVGSRTLSAFDVLIDVPNKRLVLQPPALRGRWEGVRLSSPVAIAVYHDELARADVEINGELYGGLLDLATPELVVNEGVRSRSMIEGDRARSFRMGYTGWTDVPIAVRDLPLFQGWDPEGNGFVVIGAAVAYDCAIAISFSRQELRTCVR